MRPPSSIERVRERPARRAAGQRCRAQSQDRDALERARQALPHLPDHVRGRHLDLVEGKLAVDGAVEGADLAAQRHARRAAGITKSAVPVAPRGCPATFATVRRRSARAPPVTKA